MGIKNEKRKKKIEDNRNGSRVDPENRNTDTDSVLERRAQAKGYSADTTCRVPDQGREGRGREGRTRRT